MSGPVPKRSKERRRRNKDGVEVLEVDLGDALAETIEVPAPPLKTTDEDGDELAEPEYEWEPIAVAWYLSLTRSGQAIFYEPSDWQTAYMLAEQIHRHLTPKPVQTGADEEGNPTFSWIPVPMPGAALNALLKGMSSLMTTEGERRRLRIELDRQKIRYAAGSDGGNVIPISKERDNRFKDAR